MKVSIVTPTYNSQSTVRDTLESVKTQSYALIEHIVVDGGSNDKTVSIVKDYDHVSKCVSEPDNGIYDAMNKGISLASGEIIFFLNSDDRYTDDLCIENYVDLFRSSLCDCVYADLIYVDKNNVNKIKRIWAAGLYEPGLFLKGWMPPHPTFGIKSNAIEKYGGFDLSLRSSSDYEFMLRMIHCNNLIPGYLGRTTVAMRDGGHSNRSLFSRINANLEDRKAWRINKAKPSPLTLLRKPLSKLNQFI